MFQCLWCLTAGYATWACSAYLWLLFNYYLTVCRHNVNKSLVACVNACMHWDFIEVFLLHFILCLLFIACTCLSVCSFYFLCMDLVVWNKRIDWLIFDIEALLLGRCCCCCWWWWWWWWWCGIQCSAGRRAGSWQAVVNIIGRRRRSDSEDFARCCTGKQQSIVWEHQTRQVSPRYSTTHTHTVCLESTLVLSHIHLVLLVYVHKSSVNRGL